MKRISKDELSARRAEALSRARGSLAMTNYPVVYEGFSAMGIPIDQVEPRVNVFTYEAWRALHRHVRKGEHGVRIITYIERSKTVRDRETGEETEKRYRFPRTTVVFHVSQTEPDAAEAAA